MVPDQAITNSRKHQFLSWLLLYALIIGYSSTIVGPDGLHFVPLNGASAWREFEARALSWVEYGSAQRADWMGNLLMFVPFGFLLMGTLRMQRDRQANPRTSFAALGMAFILVLLFVLAVKFAQIFFPPRTVTLNYVVAQSVGALIGIATFEWAYGHLRILSRRQNFGREYLRWTLRWYCIALVVFYLMPLDFALSPHDLMIQVGRLSNFVTAIPGSGRSPLVQGVLLLTGTIAAAPFGMLLVLGPSGCNRSFGEATARGICWMAGVSLLSTLLISATPAFLSLITRSGGIALGVWTMQWLLRQDFDKLLRRLRTLSMWALPPYLLLLLAVNGLLSTHWRSPAEAMERLNPLGLLPLFDYYIVSKAEAAKSIVAHAVMYAPIGLLTWSQEIRALTALILAVLLALIVEGGRYLSVGLEGDVNAVVVAGLAAGATAYFMPTVWWMFKEAGRHV